MGLTQPGRFRERDWKGAPVWNIKEAASPPKDENSRAAGYVANDFIALSMGRCTFRTGPELRPDIFSRSWS